MNKICLIADGDFGENLRELLKVEGYQVEIIGYPKIPAKSSPCAPDLLICNAESVRFSQPWSPLNRLQQYPYLLICEDGLVQHDLPVANRYLKLPFTDEDFFSAVTACLGGNG